MIKKNIVDNIKLRSSHSSIATRNGGVSIFSSIFIISSLFYAQGIELFDYSVLIPLSLLTVVGMYDDVYDVNFKLKLIFQIIAAKIIIDNGYILDNLHGFIGIFELNRIIAQMFTIFIIVAIINAINFIDGLDLLAICVVALFILSFEYFAIDFSIFKNLSVLILFSILPLFYFNFRSRKKVFLGDAGSMFLGGIVSIYVLTILSNEYIIKPQFDINKILFVISILTYPIIDIIRVFFLRLSKGRSPFVADKNHIHHILLKRLSSHIKSVLVIIIISLLSLIIFQFLKI
jgi:UDP-N-acetylmuramyl pentapeptide phosphotransferase/UDP-N-acetylglucosamine-1-phosphate transferase